jgi:gamma-glutamyltranspeptidase/glutathione hydrolase
LGGTIAREDLARNQAVWGEPLRISYKNWTVRGQPLPSQGYMTLQALKTIEGFDLSGETLTSPTTVHLAAEAMRLAFRDRVAYAGDPDVVDVPIEMLLSDEHGAELRERIEAQATGPAVASHGGDTTSFAVADGAGMLVSFIQSIFSPWGSAVLVPNTGVLFNNRMRGFSLDPASPNALAPGKRTVHTLNTWLLEREDGTWFAGGTPGADFQVQVNLQSIMALADWRLNAQWAIDAPRWALLSEGQLGLEARFPPETFADLAARGQRIERLAAWSPALCRSQIVGRTRQGAVFAASDPRGEGCALAW